MTLIERAGLAALRRLDPETAHGLALRALNLGLGPKAGPVHGDRLACQIAGLTLPNPIGLAAGFDKNATALAPLSRAGFGFIEIGAATPRPQPGNPKPRLFRLTEDAAKLNGYRVLPDKFSSVQQAIGTKPDRPNAARYIQSFVDEAIASGLVARLIDKHDVKGRLSVAPAR